MAAAWSQTWTFFDGEWREGNVPLWGARTHAIWLGSSVFDGARAFDGKAPDLDLHCARVNASARAMPYTLYADGSIEAELPQGTVKFASVDALRAHLEKHG